ncbi:hypothetical protein FOCC_FOCC006304 [Frankliniella occidentalis]|nr:hypothetical protein FOCC_FOCC006304 [Frankliniella occidentalis]
MRGHSTKNSTMESASTVWLCACLLYEPVKFTCNGAPLRFREKSGGDIFWIRRPPGSDPSLCVVLGSGSTKREATAKANNYLERVGRIHGEEGLTVLQFECTQDTQFSEDF